jgi:breast cancer metastasis-suppressor 1-like protein
LRDSIRADLEEKIHILEEDKTNVDFTTGLWELNSSSNKSASARRRKADPMDPDRRKKPVSVTGPYVVYMLHENEILDDWTHIKKSLTQRKIHDGKLLASR